MRLERYEARTSPTMTALAVAFLLVYGGPVIWPELPSWLRTTAAVANIVIWVVFAVDLGIRVSLASNRLRWLLRHPIDVLTVALPLLRPLRILRVFTAGHSLLTRRGGLMRTGQAVLLSALVLVLVGALAVLDAEQAVPGASIVTFPDALWWAMTTVTTVGYGDLYPVSGAGRVVAASLMVVGISVLGVVTASVAAWFVSTASGEGAETVPGEGSDGRSAAGDDALTPADDDTATRGAESDRLHAAVSRLHRAGILTAEEVAAARRRIDVDLAT